MLARFERLMEQAVEGSLRRVFATRVEPVQMAKSAARAMEQAQVVGIRGREVPNHYTVRLSPDDLERFGDYQLTLEKQVAAYLIDYARERGLRPVERPRVQLVADERVRSGAVEAEARFQNLGSAAQQEVDLAVEGTRRLRLADLAAAGETRSNRTAPPLWVIEQGGAASAALDPGSGLVRIGRADDNDLVLTGPHVSRYHAQVRRIDSSWLVYDLDSTNGTWVGSERVIADKPRALAPGTTLRIGDRDLIVRSEAP